MKKMKFRKLSRVLISISLLAIIAVSLISVPVSAALHEDDYYTGEWIINNISGAGSTTYNFGYDTNDIDLYIVVNGEITLADCYSLECNMNSAGNPSTASQLIFILQVNGYSGRYAHFYNDRIVYLLGNTVEETVYEDDPRYDQLRTITINHISVAAFRDFLDVCAEKVIPPPEPSLLDNIFGTFSEVGSWIGTIISSLVALFWSVETASLTFLGILSVAGLAFSVIMLLFSIVTRFVGFSG